MQTKHIQKLMAAAPGKGVFAIISFLRPHRGGDQQELEAWRHREGEVNETGTLLNMVVTSKI